MDAFDGHGSCRCAYVHDAAPAFAVYIADNASVFNLEGLFSLNNRNISLSVAMGPCCCVVISFA